MPTVFIILILSVLLTAVGLFIVSKDEDSVGFAIFTTGFIGAVACLVFSLVAQQGEPLVTDTKNFRIEKTPYRVIITAMGRECVYTDAYTVANADKIVGMCQKMPLNAWGVGMTCFTIIEPIFDERSK